MHPDNDSNGNVSVCEEFYVYVINDLEWKVYDKNQLEILKYKCLNIEHNHYED